MIYFTYSKFWRLLINFLFSEIQKTSSNLKHNKIIAKNFQKVLKVGAYLVIKWKIEQLHVAHDAK